MTHKLIFFLILLLFAGCQEDMLEPTDDNRPNPDGSVGFRLKTDYVAAEVDEFQTRGTPHNTLEKYNTVNVNVYSHTSDYEAASDNDVELFREIKLEQKDSKWEYNPHMFWPGVKKLSFMAYASDIAFVDAGITFTPSTGVPESINYTVPTDVTKQPDLLVSTLFNQSKVDNIFLTMKHALSCVSFCGDTPEKSVFVKKITLRNVCGTGTLALNSPLIEWQIDEDSNGITVFEAGIKDNEELQQNPTTPNYLMTETGYLMMLPQKLKNAAIDVLYWNGKDETNNKIITYTLPTDDPSYASWKPGQKYVYKFGTGADGDISVIYYEKYSDSNYGFYDGITNSLQNYKEILEAGYGAVSKKSIGNVAGIRLTNPLSPAVTSGTVVKLADDFFLYPVSQSAVSTFNLPTSTIPQNVYFNGSAKSCGMIVPHFAKGVYKMVQTAMTTHSIRTPQQMRNITSSDASSTRNTHTFTQELDLDFSKAEIGGGTLTTAVVNRQFNDLFNGQSKKIKNVKIQAFTNGALFQGNSGEIKDVVLVNSSITSSGNTGGIVAVNQASGVILRPRVIGENNSDKQFKIEGTSGYVGTIAGYNYGTITGNTSLETATELPVAEVSGWVSIKGMSAGTGGIAGENNGTITTCLVNGVYVTGANVVVAKITIEGGNYVGGIVGVNKSKIDGNHSNAGSGGTLQAEPDLAGMVSVSGNDFVGGIAGQNSGTLEQVNIRLGRGDANNAMTIKGNMSVGGIVGSNTGTLQTNAKSFISVRGNVHISGTGDVGGIVGNNQGGNIANCFVYNFYSQSTTSQLIHYAPKINGGTNVGGIAGYAGSGEIKQCAVFSTVSNTNANGGNVTNAVAEIKAKTKSVGGIVGNAFRGLTITASYVLGNIKVEGVTNSGGIVGENNAGTSITSVHIGNSGTEVSDIYNKLFKVVNLPVYDTRMQTNGGIMTSASGMPTIEGTEYIGGICGVNWGIIDATSIKDNVKIGTSSSTYVGGIAGGNGKTGIIKNSQTYNPASNPTATATIIGNAQVGGIVGINNGIVNMCQLGLPGLNNSRLISITGKTKLGGIAGSNGGAVTGDVNTLITNCNVYGKVLIDASAVTGYIVGGILGENGQTNNVVNCNVIGYASSGTSTTGYDITLKGGGHVGGIAGANYGDIHGTSASSYCKVTHTAAIASNMYAGGLVGFQQSTPTYVGKLYYCDVSQGVLIHYLGITSGAFVGQLDGQGGTLATPISFGTTLGGVTNKIYTGTTNPVIVSANNTYVILPPLIGDMPEFCPPTPTTATGNLWTLYALFNYLHYTIYK